MESFNNDRGGGRGGRFRPPPQAPEKHRINQRIRAREVRLIGDNGEQLGVVSITDALMRAEDIGLDLVEVSPNSNPPVCRLMDYGKFKYQEQKKEHKAKKHRSESELKELRVRYRTDSGDLETKLKQAREFLEEGDKVKFSMRFRGREAMYLDLGREKFDTIVERLSDISVVEERSPVRGSYIYIVLIPLKPGQKAAKAPGTAQPSAPTAQSKVAQQSSGTTPAPDPRKT